MNDKVNMTVVNNKPKVKAEMSYDERRKHIRSIIFGDNDLTLTKVAEWTGREDRSSYKYVQQVLKGYPGKRSEKVLNQVEHELRVHGYWEEPSNS